MRLLAASAFALIALSPAAAAAFCQSTTCFGDCARDVDGCKTEGLPLAWPSVVTSDCGCDIVGVAPTKTPWLLLALAPLIRRRRRA